MIVDSVSVQSFGHQLPLLHHVGHLGCQPGPQGHREGMGNPQFGGVFGPEGGEVDVLADLAAPVHLDGFALQLGQFEFDGGAGVGHGDFELQFELVAHQFVGVGAVALPLDAVGGGLYFEPVVVLQFVGLDVQDDGLEFLLEPFLPLLVFGTRVSGQQGDLGGRFLDRTHHVEFIINKGEIKQEVPSSLPNGHHQSSSASNLSDRRNQEFCQI